ncbi:MAG: hypothetical protein ABIJ18_00530 [archaeon]
MEEIISLKLKKAFIEDLTYIGSKAYNLKIPSGGLESKDVWTDKNVKPVYDCFVSYVKGSIHYRTNDSFKEDFDNWNSLYFDSLWFFKPRDVFDDAARILRKYNLIQ